MSEPQYNTHWRRNKMKKINRIGETKINNQGLKMTIIEYNRNDNIVANKQD